MANELGREALRRFREEQALREQEAALSPRQPEAPARRQMQIRVTVTAAEYAEFEKLARAAKLTLSNYGRQRWGMQPIRPGRPQKIKA